MKYKTKKLYGMTTTQVSYAVTKARKSMLTFYKKINTPASKTAILERVVIECCFRSVRHYLNLRGIVKKGVKHGKR